MNLQALQYIDISSAIAEVLRAEELFLNSAMVQRIEGSGHNRYVVVEGPGYKQDVQSLENNIGERELYLKARPVFSDSLLSTEISICFADGTFAHRYGDKTMGTSGSSSNVIDVPLDTDLHYRLQDPLPEYLGAQMYREGRQIVLILDDPSRLATTDTRLVLELKKKLKSNATDNQFKDKVQLSCFVDSNSKPFDNQINPFFSNKQMKFHKISHLCHRLNVIGKSHLVLCDSSGTAVDAIRSAVPVAFLGEVPAGYNKIQDSVHNFLRHGDQHRLLLEQRLAIEDILQHHHNQSFVMSNQSTLQSLIISATKHILDIYLQRNRKSPVGAIDRPTVLAINSQPQPNDSLILNTQHTLCSKTTNTVRLKSSLASSRRKYQKFRESPARFLEDSQNSILKFLVASRSS